MTRFVTLRVWTQVHHGLGGNWGNSLHFRAATPWVRSEVNRICMLYYAHHNEAMLLCMHNFQRARARAHQLSRHKLETWLSSLRFRTPFPSNPKIKRLCFLYFICLLSFGLISVEKFMENKLKKKFHFFLATRVHSF